MSQLLLENSYNIITFIIVCFFIEFLLAINSFQTIIYIFFILQIHHNEDFLEKIT